MQNKSSIKGIILAVIGPLLWGISGTMTQFLFQEKNFTPEWLVNIRLLISGFILIAISIINKNPNTISIWKNKHDRRKLLIFSILGMLGVQYTYFAAIIYSNAATATILQYLSPVMITCYIALKIKKVPSSKEICSIILALTGTFLIITKGNLGSLSISHQALFWGLCSAVTSSIYTLQPIKLIKKYDSITIVGWGMLLGGLLFTFIGKPWHCSGSWSSSSLLAVSFVVIFGTLIAFSCYIESLKYISPSTASILGSGEPLSAALLSVIFLNTPLGFYQWLGTAFIIVTIILLSKAS